MPLGPFDPIPIREKVRRAHVNELREALTGVQDAYDVAVADGFTGTQAEWLASLKGAKGDPGPPGSGTTEAENALGAAGGGLLADGQVTATTYGPDGTLIPAANALLKEGMERDGLWPDGSGGGAVDSVNGQTGAVVLDASDVGALPDTTDSDDVLPSQTGNSGKYLTTNGTTASWGAVSGGSGGDVNLLQALDIWEAVNNTTLGITTYAGYISYIDAQLSGEDVTKTQIGTSDDETTPIWMYTSGPDGVPHILLNSGLHGSEGMGWHAAMRFFLGFVTDSNPVMATLRGRCRISWVAHANPGSYLASRNNPSNPNPVDLNRNFQYLNGLHPQSYGLEQPETAALRTVVQDNPIGLVIDCHTEQLGIDGGSRDNLFMYSLPSAEAGVNRSAGASAIALWAELYQPAVGYQTYNTDPVMPVPGFINWAAKALRYELDRTNGTSFLIDCGRLLAGSTDNTNSTAEAMRLYCGMLHLVVATWLTQGQQPDVIPPYTFTAARLTPDHGTAVGSGGTLISTTSAAAIQFDEFAGYVATKRNYIRVTLRTPGYFMAETTLILEGDSGATDAKPVEVTYQWGDPIGGVATLTAADAKAYAYVPAGGGRITLQHSLRLEPTALMTANRFDHELRVLVRLLGSTSDPVKVLAVRVNVTHIPTDYTSGLVPVLSS